MNKQTNEYIILQSNHRNDLIKSVELHLLQGWKLQGGIAVAIHSNSSKAIYCQALIKINENDLK